LTQGAEFADIAAKGAETVFHVFDVGFGVGHRLTEGTPEVSVFAGAEVVLAGDVEGAGSAYHDEVGDFRDAGGQDDFSRDFNKWHYPVLV
jgi:hypothetical protein